MKHFPECRYCGVRVEFFGDVCESCEDGHDPDVWADMHAERIQMAAMWED